MPLSLMNSGEPATPRERVPRWWIGERLQWFPLVVEGKYKIPYVDQQGDQLEDLADDLNLTILNTGENTYVSKTNGTESAHDISAISYASANNAHWKVLDAAISDHFPVLSTFPIVQEPTTQEKRSWNFRKANWDGFTQELENLCSDLPKHNDVEKLPRLFTSCIQKVAKHHIPRGKRRNNWIPFWKDHNIKDLIQERDSIS
ncbi:reverse transcriptase domain-containing protein [Trichonephila clavipes]|nr:reverse transcriptase domain-containing protein [Trichonephila clavipes]